MRDQDQVFVEGVVRFLPFEDQAAHFRPGIAEFLADIERRLRLRFELRQGHPREALVLRIFLP
jgi:hypothetical protein